MQTNERVSESRQKLEYLSADTIQSLTDFLLNELSEPSSELEQKALNSLKGGNYDEAKLFCLSDPCNSYLAAISCIASAFRSPMVADSVIRDAARHTVEVVKRRAERRIAEKFQEKLLKMS
jgi:natural product precursor